jgi:hypothetical protein
MIDDIEPPVSPNPAASGQAEGAGGVLASANCGEGPAELGARRRRALGYKGRPGPRSPRGKRRSSINRLTRFLLPFWVAKDLQARGEDPQEFRRLHRDLIGWLGPDDARGRVMVEALVEAWCEKIRRLRNWVGAGSCDCTEINARIDDTLKRFIWAQRLGPASGLPAGVGARSRPLRTFGGAGEDRSADPLTGRYAPETHKADSPFGDLGSRARVSVYSCVFYKMQSFSGERIILQYGFCYHTDKWHMAGKIRSEPSTPSRN